ncbi:ATP-dependent DNA helicase RecQ [Phormidesmis priestleyi ULC007]|uniref:ATP-dependent DNA helicase RecQ n=1 Tax=Phormidesmis priestleyi ULC007 TaxID=1920490 RepID=A0A2T1DEL3_9CYAN|nr:ATP-dependent DNA helicase RecQ [Phormidesmis priestleyi]PSB18950.1 ATP-dependent DNA helicase RecQ [Phormidesmis priestleyi ULC007]PZO53938.1 MAG: ATP-dependent DNA helicase RecQ [Phormidesmis priestleyi]
MNLPRPSSKTDLRSRFKQIWGYDDFRSPQGEIVETLLSQKDALIIMPTGGGKSICFQLPALMQTGLTLVVSPLVALMENQVQELRQRRLPAALLHSELSAPQRKQVLWAIEAQQLRLLYLSPETLLSASVWQRLWDPRLQINGIILDEAHCLAQWGDTFRPAYYRLGAVRSALLQHKPAGTRIAIAAFTATADPQTQQTIERVLQLQDPQVFRLNPYRSNLSLTVQTVQTPRGRRDQLLKLIQSQLKQSGLVYVRTRRDSEELSEWLRQRGYKTAAYHAGLGASDRRRIEQAWLTDALQFVVCTCAFGMGVNKANVRWIVHFHAPFLLSEYVQEIGRAGRDGKPAKALMLVSGWLDSDDQQRWKFFETQARSQQQTAQKLIKKLPQQGNVNEVAKQFKESTIALSLLQSLGRLTWSDPFHYTIHATDSAQTANSSNSTQPMRDYLKTRECRWGFLLRAFGFENEAMSFKCGRCDRCRV